MCSMLSTRRPRLCTIWTPTAPEAVLTRRTKTPTAGDYRRSHAPVSDHNRHRARPNAQVSGTPTYKIARSLQLRPGGRSCHGPEPAGLIIPDTTTQYVVGASGR